MNVALLDVNVLIALVDPNHVNHDEAHDWFAPQQKKGWATCPLTENAVVRILSNPSYPNIDLRPGEVLDLLGRFLKNVPGHVFWADSISLQDEAKFNRSFVQGTKQLTDIYLLGLAVDRGATLATFDAAIPKRAVVGGRGCMKVLSH